MATIFGVTSLQIIDHTGEIVSLPVHWNSLDTTTLAQVVFDHTTLVTRVQACIGPQVAKATFKFAIPGLTVPAPDSVTLCEDTGLIRFFVHDGKGGHSGVPVPGVLAAKYETNKKTLNLSDSAIASLITQLTGGGLHTTWDDHNNNYFQSVLDGHRVVRKFRKQASKH